jgi:PAS domain S-box-containing protein
MKIDLQTLVIVLVVIQFTLGLAVLHQYNVNKAYKGVMWWLLWLIADMSSFVFMLFRNIPSIFPAIVMLQNLLLVAGAVFLYVGVIKFFDKRVNLKLIIPVITVYAVGLTCFIFILDDIRIRSYLINTTLSFFALLTAYNLFFTRYRSLMASAYFIGTAFLLHGCVFIIRTVFIIGGISLTNFFEPNLFNLIAYFDILIASLLWTIGFIVMINQRSNAEMAEAKEDMALIFNATPDAIVITQMEDGIILDVNHGFSEITGYTRESMLGRTTLEIPLWQNYSDRQKVVDKVREQGYCDNFESNIIRNDGQEITGLLSVKRINLHGRQRLMTTIRNITERKRVDEELKESILQFRSLFENMAEGVALHEMIFSNSQVPVDYRIIDVNHAFEEITGITGESVRGKLATELYGVEKAPYIDEYYKAISSGKSFSFETHFAKLEKDFIVSVVTTKPGFFATIFLDITNRKQLEAEARRLLDVSERSRETLLSILEDQLQVQEALRANEQQLHLITDNVLDTIWMMNMDMVITWTSPSVKRVRGYTLEELAAMPLSEQLSPGSLKKIDELKAIYLVPEKLLDPNLFLTVSEELEYTCKDGSTYWTDTVISLLRDKSGTPTGILGVARDMTARMHAEEEIRKMNEILEQRVLDRTAQLEASNQELESFSYSVSHDLRAPLRHISGYVDLLTSRFKDVLPDKGKHYLDSIADSTLQMGLLIDDLLQFSRAGRVELQKSSLDMNYVLGEAMKTVVEDISEREIEWVIEKLPHIYGDENLLRLVWVNLLSNAVKFTRTRKPALIEIGSRSEKNELVFFVRDNGAGFDMQYAQKLFGVFQRFHAASEFEGTGIGLANVRRIILKHGGRIWAEADVNKGATFYFTLPKK